MHSFRGKVDYIKVVKGSQVNITQQERASRLSLLFVAHDVDYETCTVPFILKKGQSRKSAALNIIANDLAIWELSMRHDGRRSRSYKLLLEIGGLGSLLELGKEVAALCVYTKPTINMLKMITSRRVLHRWEYGLKKGDKIFCLHIESRSRRSRNVFIYFIQSLHSKSLTALLPMAGSNLSLLSSTVRC